MDWAFAIERNRAPLLRIAAMLSALFDLGETGTIERLPLVRYRAVLSLLRPAESAVRRLIVVVAGTLNPEPLPVRPVSQREAPLPDAEAETARIAKGQNPAATPYRGRIAFQLCDPRPLDDRPRQRHFSEADAPRIRLVAEGPPVPEFLQFKSPILSCVPAPQPEADKTINAVPLSRRLAAITAALEDLPYQARRYLRRQAKLPKPDWPPRPSKRKHPVFVSTLRSGAPPGYRKRPRPGAREVNDLLFECDELAKLLPKQLPRQLPCANTS